MPPLGRSLAQFVQHKATRNISTLHPHPPPNGMLVYSLIPIYTPGWREHSKSYSETGCSFARHFAILSRNVGILIGSFLRASCNLHEQVGTFNSNFARASCQAPVINLPYKTS